MRLPLNYINQTGRVHTATVIFFHGSGDTGSNLIEWVRFLLGRDMDFQHVRIIYPTAPLQPYTPSNGELSHVWFDRRAISIEAKENRKSMAQIYQTVNDLIKEESERGIPANRIVVGGFSMGGALAMHLGYHINTDVAGVFACSSFLNRDSIVYDSLRHRTQPGSALPELRMYHGDRDDLVPLEWGKESFEKLKELGVDGQFFPIANTMHELKKSELLDLKQWILTKVPMLEGDLQHKL